MTMSDSQEVLIELEDQADAAPRQLRLVSTGLAPTADVPTSPRRKPEARPCYGPCKACGAAVLTGRTAAGVEHALDVNIPTFTVLWENQASSPSLRPSGGYPVHRCGGKAEREEAGDAR
jgi:hypothetical protein